MGLSDGDIASARCSAPAIFLPSVPKKGDPDGWWKDVMKMTGLIHSFNLGMKILVRPLSFVGFASYQLFAQHLCIWFRGWGTLMNLLETCRSLKNVPRSRYESERLWYTQIRWLEVPCHLWGKQSLRITIVQAFWVPKSKNCISHSHLKALQTHRQQKSFATWDTAAV